MQTNEQLTPEHPSNQPIQSELADLHARHAQCSRMLEQLIHKPYPTADEQMEELRLKKLKLSLKDQMAALSR